MKKLLEEMSEEFEITVTTNRQTFLGMELEINKDLVRITHTKYAEIVLKRFYMQTSMLTRA